jgi:carbon storage regulator
MLYLARKEGESIIINNCIEMTVVEVRGRTVRLGFTFPPEATIMRKELYDKIRQQNIAASASDIDENAFEVDIDFDLSRGADE